MQFHKTWDSQFGKIVQCVNPCDNNFYQSQINNQDKPKLRSLGIRRQQCRIYNIQQLVRSFENYVPVSDLVDWPTLKAKQNALLKRYRESVYFGEFLEGQRTGIGIMLYSNGRLYEGQWLNNFKHGKGYQKFQNGAIYKGTYANGKPQGYGTYSWENGQTYQGQWFDGTKNGSGIWRGPTGDSYIGEWKDGQANGYGVHTWVNGDRYEGQFKDCLKHGEGVEKFFNGDSYKGTYVMGKPHGYGQYYWSMGSFFKGNFINGLRDGKGVWKRGPGNTDKYEGEYKQDKKQGYGVFTWENGNIYKGNYSNDLRNGYGQMYGNNGRIYKGQWIDNEEVDGVQQFLQEQHQCVKQTERYHKQLVESRPSNQKQKTRSNRKKQTTNQQQSDCCQFFQYNPACFQYPEQPFQTQRKFRARQIMTKRQSREKIQSQKSTRHQMNSTGFPEQNKFVRKYSVGSRCSTNRKIKQQGNSETKMMSSTFFLYKIHSKSPGLQESYVKPKPRQVKTSGGMRQKHISQQIKYFTRSKINPQFL